MMVFGVIRGRVAPRNFSKSELRMTLSSALPFAVQCSGNASPIEVTASNSGPAASRSSTRARASAAHRSRSVRSARGSRPSSFGRHQTGVRWKTVSCSTIGAIDGITWTAEAPVPITATRLPDRSCSWSQREVCITGPA